MGNVFIEQLDKKSYLSEKDIDYISESIKDFDITSFDSFFEEEEEEKDEGLTAKSFIEKMDEYFSKEENKNKDGVIYFHVDLDGVISAIAMRELLAAYDIKTKRVQTIQYGDKENYVQDLGENEVGAVVDFAKNPTSSEFHLDHHDRQQEGSESKASLFIHAKSNAATINGLVKQKGGKAFNQSDAKMVSMVDSAEYAAQDLSPKEVVEQPLRIKDKSKRQVVLLDKLILSNKPRQAEDADFEGFPLELLEHLVMVSPPSFRSIYLTLSKITKKGGKIKYDGEEVDFGKTKDMKNILQQSKNYVKQQEENIVKTNMRFVFDIAGGWVVKPKAISKVIKDLSGGESTKIANVVIQNSGGFMGEKKENGKKKGRAYNRYVPFLIHGSEKIDFLIMIWKDLGLLQITKNPFKKQQGKINSLHLGQLVDDVMQNVFSKDLEQMTVSLKELKEQEEKSITRLFEKRIKKTIEKVPKEYIDNPPEQRKKIREKIHAKGYTKLAQQLEKAEKFNKSIGFNINMFENLVKNIGEKIIKRANKDQAYINAKRTDYTKVIRQAKEFKESINKYYKDLSPKEKNDLEKIKINVWDLIDAEKGGHPGITNIPKLNLIENYNMYLSTLVGEVMGELGRRKYLTFNKK